MFNFIERLQYAAAALSPCMIIYGGCLLVLSSSVFLGHMLMHGSVIFGWLAMAMAIAFEPSRIILVLGRGEGVILFGFFFSEAFYFIRWQTRFLSSSLLIF